LLENGLRIFEYSGDAPMHAKGFLVDDAVAVIGSYNATFTAEKYYTESAIAVYDTTAVADVEKMFDADLACCKEVTIQDMDRRRKAQRAARAF
jgi:cardiolipin synthase